MNNENKLYELVEKMYLEFNQKFEDMNQRFNNLDNELKGFREETNNRFDKLESKADDIANKIDDLLLMPGNEFSYEQSVGPVIQANGYTYAPVISDGKLIQGIGGGVCQVSSTLYNTQLKAGILPTERRNHSHPVSYVPRGLDATLASGSIDYKFKNTHEYPIVINTHTEGGKLTIELWSNEHALKGIEYKAVGYASGKTANSYLYGYDKDGNKVYEKHIDTSVYR